VTRVQKVVTITATRNCVYLGDYHTYLSKLKRKIIENDETNEGKKVFENRCSGSAARVKNVVRNGATRKHTVLSVSYEYIWTYMSCYGEILIVHLE
jgi:hypothetical protein